MKIFVASLPFNIMEADLFSAFADFGIVDSAKIVANQKSGRIKGFGFVEMPDEPSALKAIAALNGAKVCGRNIVVNQAEFNAEF
jgi:RNA recognition motif-containing protein